MGGDQPGGAEEIAQRSRGTPGLPTSASRVRDFAQFLVGK